MKTARDLSTKRESLGAIEGSDFSISAQTFTFSELLAATSNFRTESLLGEGGFGRVYRGRLETTGQVVFQVYSLFCVVNQFLLHS